MAPSVNYSAIKDGDVLETGEVSALINTAIKERNKEIVALMYEAALRRTALINSMSVITVLTTAGRESIYPTAKESRRQQETSLR